MAAEVTVFETLPIRKRVWGVTEIFLSTSAKPNPSLQIISPSFPMVMDRPGILWVFMNFSMIRDARAFGPLPDERNPATEKIKRRISM